jgi:hypothetical protein
MHVSQQQGMPTNQGMGTPHRMANMSHQGMSNIPSGMSGPGQNMGGQNMTGPPNMPNNPSGGPGVYQINAQNVPHSGSSSGQMNPNMPGGGSGHTGMSGHNLPSGQSGMAHPGQQQIMMNRSGPQPTMGSTTQGMEGDHNQQGELFKLH